MEDELNSQEDELVNKDADLTPHQILEREISAARLKSLLPFGGACELVGVEGRHEGYSREWYERYRAKKRLKNKKGPGS